MNQTIESFDNAWSKPIRETQILCGACAGAWEVRDFVGPAQITTKSLIAAHAEKMKAISERSEFGCASPLAGQIRQRVHDSISALKTNKERAARLAVHFGGAQSVVYREISPKRGTLAQWIAARTGYLVILIKLGNEFGIDVGSLVELNQELDDERRRAGDEGWRNVDGFLERLS